MLQNLPAYIAWTRKALVNAAGLLTSLLALGLLPDQYAGYVAAALAVITAILHFNVSNADAPGSVEAVDEGDPDEEHPTEWQPAALITPSEIAAAHKQAAPTSP
jgi:hypothetical protein